MDRICAGLNVIEFGSGSVAASIAGVVFADAGARVIKVEPPEGDRLRTADGQDQLRDLVAKRRAAKHHGCPGNEYPGCPSTAGQGGHGALWPVETVTDAHRAQRRSTFVCRWESLA